MFSSFIFRFEADVSFAFCEQFPCSILKIETQQENKTAKGIIVLLKFLRQSHLALPRGMLP